MGKSEHDWLEQRLESKMCIRDSAGALDGNSINDLNDMIRVAEQVSDYILIPNVNSDVTLGRYVAVAGQIQGDPRFPEAAWPYLDFAKIGAEYYAEHGLSLIHIFTNLKEVVLNQQDSGFHSVQLFQFFHAGTPAMDVHVVITANLFQICEVRDHRRLLAAEGQVDEILHAGEMQFFNHRLKLRKLAHSKACLLYTSRCV